MSKSDSTDSSDLANDFIAGAAAPSTAGYIDRYRKVAVIGTGGMGEVWCVEDPELGRNIALKLIRPNPGSNAEVRAKQEIKILKLLHHDNIVRLLGEGISQGGETYFTMELIEGMSLADLLGKCGGQCRTVRKLLAPLAPVTLLGGPMSDIAMDAPAYIGAIRIVQQIASALVYLHSKNITHRDIKPSNILLKSSGRALLTDFGIAHFPRQSAIIDLTNADAFIGTSRYAAPEQHAGEPVDQRTDVYGLGTVLYELICGVPLFPSTTNVLNLSGKIQYQCPKAPILLAPQIPSGLNAAIMKALHRYPAQRFANAMEFAETLQEFIAPKPPKLLDKAVHTSGWIIKVCCLLGLFMAGSTAITLYFHDYIQPYKWRHPLLPAVVPFAAMLLLGIVVAGSWYLLCFTWDLICRILSRLRRPKAIKS